MPARLNLTEDERRERIRAQDRERHRRWKERDPEHVRQLMLARGRRYTKKHRSELRAKANAARAKNPEKHRARLAVSWAVKKGYLVPQPCCCGSSKAEAHHSDYSKKLEVIWLCPKHHKELHRKLLL